MEKPLFRTNDFDRLSDLTNQIDNLLNGVRRKFDNLQMEIEKLETKNIFKIANQILEKNESSLLETGDYPVFRNLNIQHSIEYLLNQIYNEYGTTSILHFFDFDEACWSESLRLNLFRTLRSLFIHFYELYSSSYLVMELTQESEMVMVDMKFKGCNPLDVNESDEHKFDSIEFLVEKMYGNFSINHMAEKQVEITLVVPLYI